MLSLNRLMYEYLGSLGYTGSINYRTREALLDNTGLNHGSINYLWYYYLKNLGYSGSINNMMYEWLGDKGYTGSINYRLYQALQDGDLFGTFSPLTLFDQGQQGAWYDPSDLSTLFQDSAGTTPVVADGDPVGLMLDKSGNGNHASQSTTAAKPTYKIIDGYQELNADGVDDWMLVSNQILNQEEFTCLFVARGSGGGRLVDSRGTGSAGTVPGWHVKPYSAGLDNVIVDDGNGHSIVINSATAGLLIFSVTYHNGILVYRRDGVEVARTENPNIESVLTTLDSVLFCNSNGKNTQFYAGGFKGFIFADYLLSQNVLEQAEHYLATQAGVQLNA